MACFLRLHPPANVAVVVSDLSPGDIVGDVRISRRIPRGHKAAVGAIAKDVPALNFGQFIGFTTADIAPGDWVHEHNIAFHSVDRDYEFGIDARDPAPAAPPAIFQGFRRATGPLYWSLFVPAFCYLVVLSFGFMAPRMGHK